MRIYKPRTIYLLAINFAQQDGQYVWVIDQVWGQDGWILAKFFFCVFIAWFQTVKA